MLHALERGADGVEFDVHLSADLVPFVHHDPLLARTTLHPPELHQRPLASLTADQLRQIPLAQGLSQDLLPTLDDVLDALLPSAHDREIWIELKPSHHPQELVARTLRAVLERDPHLLDQAWFLSFEPDLLARLQRQEPRARGALLATYDVQPVFDQAHAMGLHGVGMAAVLSPPFAQQAYHKGLRLLVGGPGVDHPDLLRQVLVMGNHVAVAVDDLESALRVREEMENEEA